MHSEGGKGEGGLGNLTAEFAGQDFKSITEEAVGWFYKRVIKRQDEFCILGP